MNFYAAVANGELIPAQREAMAIRLRKPAYPLSALSLKRYPICGWSLLSATLAAMAVAVGRGVRALPIAPPRVRLLSRRCALRAFSLRTSSASTSPPCCVGAAQWRRES